MKNQNLFQVNNPAPDFYSDLIKKDPEVTNRSDQSLSKTYVLATIKPFYIESTFPLTGM